MSSNIARYDVEERAATDLSHVEFTDADRAALSQTKGIEVDTDNTVHVSHYIGTIGLPSNKYLEIKPKDSLSNFKPLYYLAKAGRINEELVTGPREIGFSPGDSFVNIMAIIYEEELQRLLRKGLHQRYVSRSESTPYVRGQLRLTDQLASQEPLATAFESRYQEQTTDLPLNQLLRYTLRELEDQVTSKTLADRLHQRFEQLGKHVSSPNQPPNPEQIRLTKDTQAYRPLIELAEQILEETYIDTFGHRSQLLSSVVVNTERLFEELVFEAIAAVAADTRFRVAGDADPTNTSSPAIGYLLERSDGKNIHQLQPDVFLHVNGEPSLIADAKWHERSSPRNVDIYQVTSYQRYAQAPALMCYPAQGGAIEEQYDLKGISRQEGKAEGLEVIEIPTGGASYDKFEEELHRRITAAIERTSHNISTQ